MSHPPQLPRTFPSRGLIGALAGSVTLFLFCPRLMHLSQADAAARSAIAAVFVLLAALALFLLRREGIPLSARLSLLPVIGFSLLLRTCFLDYQTPDYLNFLSDWAAFFRENGGFAALKYPVSNYNTPYLYFLAAISYLPIPDLYLIKLFSILFDILLAWSAMRLTARLCPSGSRRPPIAFCLCLLLPTVILNGACWGQCDSIYTALMLLALDCALDRKGIRSTLLLALAFSFKLQTVFLFPLWGILWVTGRIRLRQLCLFPLFCLAPLCPALLLGKPLRDTLSVYPEQMAVNSSLTFNAPSMYALIPYGHSVRESLFAALGIAAALLFSLALLLLLYRFRRCATPPILIFCALVLALAVPFLLPFMHDRYFFSADVLALIAACSCSKGIPVAAAVQLASLSAYGTYLRNRFTFPLYVRELLFPMGLEALLILFALLLSCAHLLILLHRTKSGAAP